MGFLGLGAPEMLIIAVIALVIFGPNRLPEVAGQLGKVVRDIRRMTTELTSELEKNADLKDIKDAVQKELGGIQTQVNAATAAVNKEVKGATNAINAATNTTVSPAKPTTTTTATAAKPVTATSASSTPVVAKKVATKSDPLADVTFFEIPEEKPEEAKLAPATNGHVPDPAPPTSIAQLDAIGRARQRRAAAGYNNRRAAS
jgi:sec-independent protein translocase protein TatB